MVDYLLSFWSQHGSDIALYFPLGAIGIWRWSVWIIKRTYANFYKPPIGFYSSPVSVVTPVYNENPHVFHAAVSSWIRAGVQEVIAVIDYTDTACIRVFNRLAKTWPHAHLIVTRTPGKRPALAEGIRFARHDILALVDSDVIWLRDTLPQALIPFADPWVGGVAGRQNVVNPRTFAQRIFDMQLDQRYLEELPFMTARGGHVVTCISGRTAFYRRGALLPILPEMEYETFFGKQVLSGEDKRLTYLIEREGWKVAYQQRSRILTTGSPDLKTFLKQRLRWMRNSWRADLRTLSERWVWKHPRFAFYLVDRAIQPFTQLMSPIFFIVSLSLGLYIPAAIIFFWWPISRVVRQYPHLRRKPRDLFLIPFHVFLQFFLAATKIYAFVTMNRQGWITRWDSSRLTHTRGLLGALRPYVATASIYFLLAAFVVFRHESLIVEHARIGKLAFMEQSRAESMPQFYHAQFGDTLANIAQRSGIIPSAIQALNPGILLHTLLEPDFIVFVPHNARAISSAVPLTPNHISLAPLNLTYDPVKNRLRVKGSGRIVTSRDVDRALNEQVTFHNGVNINGRTRLVLEPGIQLGNRALQERFDVLHAL